MLFPISLYQSEQRTVKHTHTEKNPIIRSVCFFKLHYSFGKLELVPIPHRKIITYQITP